MIEWPYAFPETVLISNILFDHPYKCTRIMSPQVLVQKTWWGESWGICVFFRKSKEVGEKGGQAWNASLVTGNMPEICTVSITVVVYKLGNSLREMQ